MSFLTNERLLQCVQVESWCLCALSSKELESVVIVFIVIYFRCVLVLFDIFDGIRCCCWFFFFLRSLSKPLNIRNEFLDRIGICHLTDWLHEWLTGISHAIQLNQWNVSRFPAKIKIKIKKKKKKKHEKKKSKGITKRLQFHRYWQRRRRCRRRCCHLHGMWFRLSSSFWAPS